MRLSVMMMLCAMSSVAMADEQKVFTADNGIQLINIQADKSIKMATFGGEFEASSLQYVEEARKPNDPYLMHCFARKKKDSNNYLRMAPDTHHVCLNETGKDLEKGLGQLQFADFQVVKEKINNKDIKTIKVNMKGENNVMSTLTDNSSIPKLSFGKKELANSDYVYTYYSFDPSNGNILNGKIYEYYY
jgi:hypothetical protein